MGTYYVIDNTATVWLGKEYFEPQWNTCLYDDCNERLELFGGGPFCRRHTVMRHNLCVSASRVADNMLGVFALHSDPVDHNTVVFKAGDTVAAFGGRLDLFRSKRLFDVYDNRTSKLTETSYVLTWETTDATTGRPIYACLDGEYRHSGVARYINSAIHTKTASFGLEYVNCEMQVLVLQEPVAIDNHHISEFLGLVACRDIYAGEELITDYGQSYWNDAFLSKLDTDVQEFLSGRRETAPSFWSAGRKSCSDQRNV